MIQQWSVGASYSAAAHMDAIKAYIESPASGVGWSFVETYVPATNHRVDIHKLAASYSGFPGDLYVLFWYNNSQLRIALAENWDTSTKKVQRMTLRMYTDYAINPSYAIPAPGNIMGDDWLSPFTDGLQTNPYLGGAYYYFNWLVVDALAANVVCMFSATTRGLILTSKANDVYYAGFYESAIPSPSLNDPMPTVVGRNSSSYASYSTRIPMGAGSIYRGNLLGSMNYLSQYLGPRWYAESYPGNNGVGDKYLGGKFSLNAIYLTNRLSASTPSDEFGFYRGYLRDLMYVPANATYITWGDYSLDSDGNTWVFNNQGYALREYS